jgi:hypothetical protein
MDSTLADNGKLKDAVKQALIEVLQERPDLFSEIVAEALEDVALGRAIRAGEASGDASREEVMKTLERKR